MICLRLPFTTAARYVEFYSFPESQYNHLANSPLQNEVSLTWLCVHAHGDGIVEKLLQEPFSVLLGAILQNTLLFSFCPA